MAVVSNGFATKDLNSQGAVADLTVADIHGMERTELIQVIVLGQIPFLDESRLEHQDLETLRRLAFLARNCCQNQAV